MAGGEGERQRRPAAPPRHPPGRDPPPIGRPAAPRERAASRQTNRRGRTGRCSGGGGGRASLPRPAARRWVAGERLEEMGGGGGRGPDEGSQRPSLPAQETDRLAVDGVPAVGRSGKKKTRQRLRRRPGGQAGRPQGRPGPGNLPTPHLQVPMHGSLRRPSEAWPRCRRRCRPRLSASPVAGTAVDGRRRCRAAPLLGWGGCGALPTGGDPAAWATAIPPLCVFLP